MPRVFFVWASLYNNLDMLQLAQLHEAKIFKAHHNLLFFKLDFLMYLKCH